LHWRKHFRYARDTQKTAGARARHARLKKALLFVFAVRPRYLRRTVPTCTPEGVAVLKASLTRP
jgi:hypothetical protein